MTTATKDVPKKTIKVDVTSDAICPFCMLGLQNLRRAISCSKTAQLGLDFSIEFHPFLLDPTLTTQPVCKRTRYEHKFGKDRCEVVMRSLAERGKKAGIDFTFDGNISSTTTYHRLLHHAYALGGQYLQLPLVDRLNHGYFEKGKDVGDVNWLADEAVAVGVFKNKQEGLDWLNGEEAFEDVRKGYKRASDLGITGVPFFVFGNKYAISGAQPPESFFEVFQEIAKGEVLQCSECPSANTTNGTAAQDPATAVAVIEAKRTDQLGEGCAGGVVCTVDVDEENMCGFQNAAKEKEMEGQRRTGELVV